VERDDEREATVNDEIVIGGDMEDIPEGTYPATVKSITTKQSEKFGNEFRAWDFTLDSGSVVGGSSSMSTNSKSKGGKWIAAILGRQPAKGEKVLNALIGSRCLVQVIDKDGWPAVDAVLPPLAVNGATSTPQPVSVDPSGAGALPELP
jgi:hypothetical protein